MSTSRELGGRATGGWREMPQSADEPACWGILPQRPAARFGHDPARLVAYYMELQERHQDRLIDRSKAPKRGGESAA